MSAGVTTQTPSVLVFNDTDDFNAAVLNAAFASLDLRTRAIEALSVSYNDAINTLNQFGLERLNDALQPVYNALVQIGQLGVIFTSTSTSSVTAALGLQTFVLPPSDRAQFAAAATLGIDSTDGSNIALFGSLQSYDRTTGTLIVNVTQFTGSGSASAWRISAASLANFTATAESIGVYTKNEVDQAIQTSGSNVTSTLLGGVGSSGNTLQKLYTQGVNNSTQLAALVAQLQSDETQITSALTALDNRVRVDAAQSFTDAQKLQALTNIGHVTPMGQCRLNFVSATQIRLDPYNGNQIWVDGAFRTIPLVGISMSNAGLVAGTLYYIYAYMSAGALTLHASPNPPVPNAYGVMSPTGFPAETLVGMVYINGAAQFQDENGAHFVATYFNRFKRTSGSQLLPRTSSTSPVIVGYIYCLSWGEDPIDGMISGFMYNESANVCACSLGYNGVQSGGQANGYSAIPNASATATCLAPVSLPRGLVTVNAFAWVGGGVGNFSIYLHSESVQ